MRYLSLLVVVACLASGAVAEEKNVHPDTREWSDLFHADLGNAIDTKDVWTFEDGVLTASADFGLFSEKEYDNFVLDLEFKFNKKGNSGVFMRVGDFKNHVKSGFEVQILDTHGKKKFGHHDCGGVIRTSAPSKMVVKPAGQWNRYTITLQGDHLVVVLNGEKIQDLDLGQTGLQDRPASGYISFQDEAKEVWYRNVRIRELK